MDKQTLQREANMLHEQMRQYEDQILNGSIPACENIKLAVQRQKEDVLKWPSWTSNNPINTLDDELYFSPKAAFKAIYFIENLKHFKGEYAAQPFLLSDWQKWATYVLYGWQGPRGRRFRKAYVEIPRKNGKTTWASALADYHLYWDGEGAPEVYFCATEYKQAWIAYETAGQMINNNPFLNQELEWLKHEIRFKPDAQGIRKPGFARTFTTPRDGTNPSFVVVDEFHEHKTDEVYQSLNRGTGARKQPMIFTITTAGKSTTSPCYEMHKLGRAILRGQATDDSFFFLMYGLDDGDDWEDRENWKKANPSYRDIPTLIDKVYEEYVGAKNSPTAINDFKTKHLNVWTNSSTEWINHKIWSAQYKELDLSEFKILHTTSGLDVASTRDLTSFSILFKLEVPEHLKVLFNREHIYYLKSWNWVPEEALTTSKFKAFYEAWAREGHIELTPGNVIDDDSIINKILRLCTEWNCPVVAYDPFNASRYATLLGQQGLDVEQIRQGARTFSEPMKNFEKLVYSNGLWHSGNPVLGWCITNVELETDANGNIRPNRKKRDQKIDSFVASLNAMVWMMNVEYEAQQTYEYWDPMEDMEL